MKDKKAKHIGRTIRQIIMEELEEPVTRAELKPGEFTVEYFDNEKKQKTTIKTELDNRR